MDNELAAKFEELNSAIQEIKTLLKEVKSDLEPILCAYKLQQEVYAFKWKVSHAALARQIDELTDDNGERL